MYWDVKLVKPLNDYEIYVELKNGNKGVFDLKPYINSGIMKELQNISYFNQVGILFDAITWPNGQDIAPETLIADMVSSFHKITEIND